MKMSSMVGVAALLVVILVAVPAMATDYTVGDTTGWTSGYDYSNWVSDKSFKVGDTLLFSYTLLHSVNEVMKSDYDSCSSANSLQSYTDQSTKITLDKPGSRYFICGTAGHCSNGMKLAVSVSSGSGGSSGGGPTPAGSSPNSPSTPAAGTPGEPASKNTPSTAGTNAAAGGGFKGGNVVMVGVSLVGGLALMG